MNINIDFSRLQNYSMENAFKKLKYQHERRFYVFLLNEMKTMA